MINGNINNSPIRSVKGRVELYEGSTLLNTFSYDDRLANFEASREGESGKFFGFGVCQKLTLKLTDKDRELDITKDHSFKAYLTTDEDYKTPFPIFYVEDVKRDENTNELTITAYDSLYAASGITFESEKLKEQMEEGEVLNLAMYVNLVALSMGLPPRVITIGGVSVPMPPVDTYNFGEDDIFGSEYPEGANLEGTETLREVADDLAEATQSIYYIDNKNCLVFKRLDHTGAAKLRIDKADYFTLKTNPTQTLTAICRATELGDNVSTPMEIEGVRQYVRDNAFWSRDEDIQTLLDNAIAAIGGVSIAQFDCSWRGNFLLEVADKIELITKDNEVITTYLLNDKLTYDGGFRQVSKWQYTESKDDKDKHYNPSTLGEALTQTYARVDKANKKILEVVSDINGVNDNISTITQTATTIEERVSSVERITEDMADRYDKDIEEIEKSVSMKMTDEDVNIKITEALSNGVDRVETSTGFTFNEDGLTVKKVDEEGNRISETATQITENGMIVYDSNNDAVLTANNIGVDARNLHATTYLIIGKNSRFEDYPPDSKTRTACFWIGG